MTLGKSAKSFILSKTCFTQSVLKLACVTIFLYIPLLSSSFLLYDPTLLHSYHLCTASNITQPLRQHLHLLNIPCSMNQLQPACWPSNSGVSPKFDRLPPEIQTEIISYVQRPEDLKALCLTSKLVRKIATPFFYCSVSLKLGGSRDSHIIGLASSFNSGIQYIRHLDLGVVEACSALINHRTEGWKDSNQDIDDVEGSIKQAHLMVRMLLEALPRNKLKNELGTFTYVNIFPGTCRLIMS